MNRAAAFPPRKSRASLSRRNDAGREGSATLGLDRASAFLRRGKASLLKGGTRVPLIVRWPGVTKARTVSEALVTGVDFYPSLLEIAGIRQPDGQTPDGVSIVPALRGRPLQG